MGIVINTSVLAGVDAFFRRAFPSAEVFAVSSGRWGSGRGAFAARSVACVRAVAAAGGLWVSFPASACPAGLRPSSSQSRCFSGLSAGTWSSLALALGSGVPCECFFSGWCPGWLGLVPCSGLSWLGRGGCCCLSWGGSRPVVPVLAAGYSRVSVFFLEFGSDRLPDEFLPILPLLQLLKHRGSYTHTQLRCQWLVSVSYKLVFL